MTNQQCRLIASAIVIMAGGLTLSLGLIARAINIYGSGGEAAGTIILLAGAGMFIAEYIKSRKNTE